MERSDKREATGRKTSTNARDPQKNQNNNKSRTRAPKSGHPEKAKGQNTDNPDF